MVTPQMVKEFTLQYFLFIWDILSTVSVTSSQLWSKNTKWKIPEIHTGRACGPDDKGSRVARRGEDWRGDVGTHQWSQGEGGERMRAWWEGKTAGQVGRWAISGKLAKQLIK
jgi:hypothetical protein